MTIKISSNKKSLIVIPVFSDKKKINFFNKISDKKFQNKIENKIKLFNFKAENLSNLFFNIGKQKIILIGIKKDYNLEDLRKAYSNVFTILKTKGEKEVLIDCPKEIEEEIIAIIEGLDLTNYQFNKYLSKKENLEIEINLNISKTPQTKRVSGGLGIVSESKDSERLRNIANAISCVSKKNSLKFQNILNETLKINKNVKFTRDIVNENSNIQTPIAFEKQAKEFAKKNKLKIKVLNEKQIKKEKLNLLLAVGQGSQNPPRLIIIEYNGDKKSKEKLALVGKGVTFDTGGINLKPTGYLEDMKTDMGGAATVFGAFRSAVELKLKKNLILVLSCAENSISSKAYNPGDIFISHKGISVEIGNTDAEGRLVLADALSYVQKHYSPTKIIDLATLTGACLVALGPTLIGMLGNDKLMKNKIFEAGEKKFERVWELPIYDEHREMIKTKFADITNNAKGKYGGTITAAAFLEKFIDKNIKWVHLDIAGAARSHKLEFYITEFGTGIGVRLLVDFIKNN